MRCFPIKCCLVMARSTYKGSSFKSPMPISANCSSVRCLLTVVRRSLAHCGNDNRFFPVFFLSLENRIHAFVPILVVDTRWKAKTSHGTNFGGHGFLDFLCFILREVRQKTSQAGDYYQRFFRRYRLDILLQQVCGSQAPLICFRCCPSYGCRT